MSSKKRQRKNTKTISKNDNVELNPHVFPNIDHEYKNIEPTHYDKDKYFMDNSVIQDQDEEYNMSIIMDIIKMQEKEDNERKEKEEQEKIEQEKLFRLSIEKRDHNIKEILRKLKVLMNTKNSFEKNLVSILENAMNTQDLQITLYDNDLYLDVQRYLGLNNNKGIIRLSDEIKEYTNNMFVLDLHSCK